MPNCKVFGHVLDQCPKKIIYDILKNTKATRQTVCGVHIGSKSHLVYKQVQPKNDKKIDSRQPKPKVPCTTQLVNTNCTSNSFDALGSMGDMDDATGVGHVSYISEKEVPNLEKHGLTPNRAEDTNNDKHVTMESGSMPSTSMDVQDGNPESEVEEYNNETVSL